MLVIVIHDLHERAVGFRLEVCRDEALGFSPEGVVVRIFDLQLLLIVNIYIILLDD